MLVVVGGGAVRVGQAIARRHLRYLETIAVNCDARVQELDEFDRRVYLGPQGAPEQGTSGSPAVAGRLARAAEPALDRLFDGSTFVTIVASLGGGAGTGALPYVLEAATRAAEFVSVFVIKPFECEGDRRAVADRALAHLHFLDGFVEKQESKRATLTILDNEILARKNRGLPIAKVSDHWAQLVSNHIEQSFVAPIEAAVEASRLGRELPPTPETVILPALEADAGPIRVPSPAEPPMPMPPGLDAGDIAELTIEILPTDGGPAVLR